MLVSLILSYHISIYTYLINTFQSWYSSMLHIDNILFLICLHQTGRCNHFGLLNPSQFRGSTKYISKISRNLYSKQAILIVNQTQFNNMSNSNSEETAPNIQQSRYPAQLDSTLSPPPGALFPSRLYQLLEDAEKDGLESIISWMPDGKSFKVHDKEKFERDLMPRYFGSSKYR